MIKMISIQPMRNYTSFSEKLYKLTTKKLSDVELDHEELFTKFDKANQTFEH